jgi:hypothetical protein
MHFWQRNKYGNIHGEDDNEAGIAAASNRGSVR